jgi:hypothetical protein
MDPRWEDARRLHADPERLAERYGKIKNVLIGSIGKVRLPLRVPRIHLDTLSGRYTPAAISEHLFTIAYLHELSGNGLEAVRFRRAAYEIDAMEGSLKSVVFRRELGYIKGVNPAIESVIEEFVDTRSSAALDALERNMSLTVSS